ncbi:hypothetical protein [Streptomyces sp. NBC_01314]|uniref:hypothetical protein n=1 Tax=Streptomyces sp. NBC_01314 TaxID=2903821 RepID=UPI00308D87C5|nr:hypothetical protein OG622_28370 [Streptomyces sp. NBC_01314]
MTDRLDIIAAALRAPKTARPYVGHEMRGPMLMLTGANSDLIWSATIPQVAEAIDQALQEQEREEKGIPAAGAQPTAGTTSTPQVCSYGRPADHGRIAADLRARAGQWGTVGVYRSLATARSVRSQIRLAAGNYSAYGPTGSFETRTDTVPDGTRVEARYTGDSAHHAEPAPAAPSATGDDAAWADALAGLDQGAE